jgi:hypothetical protein
MSEGDRVGTLRDADLLGGVELEDEHGGRVRLAAEYIRDVRAI